MTPPLPCENCVCFAVCNAKLHQVNDVYKTQFVVSVLDHCSLLNDWINGDTNVSYTYPISKQKLDIICSIFNLKYHLITEKNPLGQFLRSQFDSLNTYNNEKIEGATWQK